MNTAFRKTRHTAMCPKRKCALDVTFLAISALFTRISFPHPLGSCVGFPGFPQRNTDVAKGSECFRSELNVHIHMRVLCVRSLLMSWFLSWVTLSGCPRLSTKGKRAEAGLPVRPWEAAALSSSEAPEKPSEQQDREQGTGWESHNQRVDSNPFSAPQWL